MTPLPVVSGADCIAALRRFGYEEVRRKGSHVRLHAPGRTPVTVPDHRELKRGTLAGILRAAKISIDEFVRALA